MVPFPDKQQATLTNAAASSGRPQIESRPNLDSDVGVLLFQLGISSSQLNSQQRIALRNDKREALTEIDKRVLNSLKHSLRVRISTGRGKVDKMLQGIPDPLRAKVFKEVATLDSKLTTVCKDVTTKNRKIKALENTMSDQNTEMGVLKKKSSDQQKRIKHYQSILEKYGINIETEDDGSSSHDHSQLPPSKTDFDSGVWPDQPDHHHHTTNSSAHPAPWTDIDQYLPLEHSEAALRSWMTLQAGEPEASGHYAL
nr:hypothetical protein L203_02044 [Cryptococcus depauperatus CBS 7841]